MIQSHSGPACAAASNLDPNDNMAHRKQQRLEIRQDQRGGITVGKSSTVRHVYTGGIGVRERKLAQNRLATPLTTQRTSINQSKRNELSLLEAAAAALESTLLANPGCSHNL